MESVFDPRKPGPMLAIVEQNDSKYYSMRAKEIISEAQLIIMGPNPSDQQLQVYQLKMTQAISLLALARVVMGSANIPEGAPRS